MSISTSDKLNVEIMDHTALITIDNPGANTWDTESLPGALDRHVAAAAYRHLSLEQLTLALRGAGARLPPDPDRQVLCCLCVHHGIDPVRLVPAAWRMRSNSTDRRPARLSLGGGPCLAFAPVY